MSSRSSFAGSNCSGWRQENLRGKTARKYPPRPPSRFSSASAPRSPGGVPYAAPILYECISSSSSTSPVPEVDRTPELRSLTAAVEAPFERNLHFWRNELVEPEVEYAPLPYSCRDPQLISEAMAQSNSSSIPSSFASLSDETQDTSDVETRTNSSWSSDTSLSSFPCDSKYNPTPLCSAAADAPTFEDENSSYTLWKSVLRRAVKRRVKKFFRHFVSDGHNEMHSITFRRRSAAAKGLLEMSSHEYDGEKLVVQMLLTDVTSKKSGVGTIFLLSDEEAEAYRLTTTVDRAWRGHEMRESSRLLNLVIANVEESTFFGEIVPQVLAEGVWGLPALLYMITSVPAFLQWVDPFFLPCIGTRATSHSPFWTTQWLRGITIIDLWLRSADREAITRPGVQEVRVSMAQFILIIGSAALTPETPWINVEARNNPPHPQDQIVVLQGIISACLTLVDAGPSTLSNVISHLPTFGPLVMVCVKTLLRSESYHSPFWITWCGLALKLLAVLRELPVTMGTPPHEQAKLAKLCLDIVLQRAAWIGQLRKEMTSMSLPKLRSEEDAFDVLCNLPEATFEKALREAFDDCIIQNDLKEQAFKILEPLLWLSNMNPQIRGVHRVLHRSGACDFLSKIVFFPVPQRSYVENRDIWRAKGDAITCLGNIMERMDRLDFNRQITKELIASVKEINEDEKTPEAQKDQALYMLQRYWATAGHCVW